MKNKFFNPLFTLIIVAAGITYLYFSDIKLDVLKTIDIASIILLFLLSLIYFYLNGLVFKFLVGMVGVCISQIETFGLAILTNYGNFFGPFRAGSALKAFYLKSTKGLPYSTFASVITANAFITYFITGIMGLVILIFLRLADLHFPPLLPLVCGGLVIVFGMPFIVKLPGIRSDNFFFRHLRSALEGFDTIRSQKNRLILVSLIFFIKLFFLSFLIMVTFHTLKTPISFQIALAISIFTSVSDLVSITPNNLGIQETVIAYLFTLSGNHFEIGFLGATLFRILRMIITFSLAPLFSHFLFHKKYGYTLIRSPNNPNNGK